VNRPAGATATLGVGGGGRRCRFSAAEPRFDALARHFDPSGEPGTEADPRRAVEVFHIHCHFDAASEAAATHAMQAVRAAVEGAGEVALHDWWWRGKNGPHECWSWELWVETESALGAALGVLMGSEAVGAGGEADRLFFLFHADTDQECTDHGARLAWVGPRDPRPLDHGFFEDPIPSYRGPAARRARRSDARDLFSMGALWPRGQDGRMKAGVYGAVQREEMDAEGPSGCEGGVFSTTEGCRGSCTVQPVLFLPHGAPPVPIEPCLSSDFLRGATARLPAPPTAIVFMSPHFMSDGGQFRLSTCPWPDTIYDFDEDTNPAALEKLRRCVPLSWPGPCSISDPRPR